MTVPITLSANDVTTAANFLEQFLTDNVPTGDFTQGTALRDIAINAIATVVAFLQADASQIRQMQSLVSVQAATNGDTEALSDAVTAILSNFFVSPLPGTLARGFAIGHSSRQVDIFIPTNNRFTYSGNLIFVVDSPVTYFVPAASLSPVTDADGSVLEYEFRFPLVATQPGSAYQIAPALFASFDAFNPYVTRVEVTTTFSGGLDPETVPELLARAPTAVSVRNLINTRSIVATLNDNFEGIDTILSVGYGDPEMQRDLIPGGSPNLALHVGGMVDVYLRTGLVETVFTGTVGGTYVRPDGLVTFFRDASADFSSVTVGAIIHVSAGLDGVSEFLVIAISPDLTTLTVSDRSPFPFATDEGSPPTNVQYTIGVVGPLYSDQVSGVGFVPLTTGVTSRQTTVSGLVTLPGGPVMDILDIAIINPQTSEAAYKSTLDGFVHFPVQSNSAPIEQTPDQGLQFQLIVRNPPYSQSALMYMDVVVGTTTNPTRFDSYTLQIRYNTLPQFLDIDTFVRGPDQRVLSAFQLPRGYNVCVLSATIQYTLRSDAATLLDENAAAQTVVDFINNFDTTATPIDVSAIVTQLRNTYPIIGSIEPITITYVLRAPTGDALTYASEDVVRLTPDKFVTGPTLNLPALGVSDRNIQYVADTVGILVQST